MSRAFPAMLLGGAMLFACTAAARAADPQAPAPPSDPSAASATPASSASAAPAEDPAKKRLAMLRAQPLGPEYAIFNSADFPKIDFFNKALVEAAVGSYQLKTRFFDAQWQEVTTPQAPGRYGALVGFHSAEGLSYQLARTLFKTAQPYWPQYPKKDPYNVTLRFPGALGLPDTIATTEQWNINDWAALEVANQSARDGRQAELAAALADITNDPDRWRGFNVSAIECAWWAELFKRLGEKQDYVYAIERPADYDQDKASWPLLLFLHGWNGQEADIKRVRNAGPLSYIHKGHPLPFIVVAPSCPLDPAGRQVWDPERLLHLIDEVAASNRVDPKRIYVTGLSMGGFGAIDLAAAHPDRIAAIAPQSSGENPALAPRLKDMPAWFFHGAEDHSVPPHYSTDLYEAMQKLGAPVKLTLYPGLGHSSEAWNKTYNDPELYTWFLTHSK